MCSLNFKVESFFVCFSRSEKEEWQKKKEILSDTQSKLEEQKQVDAVKIQKFNVSWAYMKNDYN